MTRRERLERKLEKRQEWAKSRERKAEAAFNAAHATPLPPFGEPIKIGHHSEKRHRAAIARVDSKMHQGFEHENMAKHHESKAGGLADQLDQSIYSDDPDAIERLEERLAELEADRERRKAKNAEWRKTGRVGPCPYQPYELSNLNGRIKNARDRIGQVKRRQQLQAQAEEAGGVHVIVGKDNGHGAYCQVVFAEKPDRSVIVALKAAGFSWGCGRWTGPHAKLPECVSAML